MQKSFLHREKVLYLLMFNKNPITMLKKEMIEALIVTAILIILLIINL